MRAGRLFSVFLWLAGLMLVAAGSWIWFDSWQGQEEARKEWPQPEETPVEPEGIPTPQRPGVLARIWFPRLHQERFVLEGATKKNLARGPAWLSETAKPGSGNCIIAGHRDTHFRILKEVKQGDEILLEYNGQSYLYRVRSMHVVQPSHKELLRPAEEPVLTLVTCYPFYWVGSAPERYIVRAELAGEIRTRSSRAI
jgi:sortase A